jgi:protein phosphatase
MTDIRAAGDSHVGSVRSANEDAIIVDDDLGLYAVLDGMGGAMAGDVAARLARDTLSQFVRANRRKLRPRDLMDAAIQASAHAVHEASWARRDRNGMGTTVVACLIDNKTAVLGHVGDSRGYLLRDGRLTQLTRDHTVVAELVERGTITAEEAEHHVYKNVLSRNLGSRPDAKVDITEVELAQGDRLLLCSDGLYGYSTHEGIQYLLGSDGQAAAVVDELIELALRGGGGDNVSAIIVERELGSTTVNHAARPDVAHAWRQQRGRFVAAAEELGISASPIGMRFGPNDALDMLAGSLCEAIFADLEKSTGVNVWTFAHNLAIAWLGRGGAWQPLRTLLDSLRAAAMMVIADVGKKDAVLGKVLEVDVTRALVVAELAVGSVLSDHLRVADAELAQVHAARQAALEMDSNRGFVEQDTTTFIRAETTPSLADTASPEVMTAVRDALADARARASGLTAVAVSAVEAVARDPQDTAEIARKAREIYGARTLDQAGIGPLYDALENARRMVADAVNLAPGGAAIRASLLRRAASAHQQLVCAVTDLVVEASQVPSEKLRRAQAATAELRARLATSERRLADLERRFATVVDHAPLWGMGEESAEP